MNREAAFRAASRAVAPAPYALSRWIFLRGLGAIYIVAFVSFGVQAQGLIGPDGILPAQDLLAAVRSQTGVERYYFVPTVLWLGAGARALDLVVALGVAASVLLLLDRLPRAGAFAAWALYLSLVSVGQDFLSFQWDVLLLEAGLIAVLLAPGGSRRDGRATVPWLLAVLVWFLLFRLTFESGIVKLTSGDPTWRNLTALDYHYWTQPLPTWTAWYANLAPEAIKKLSVLLTFVLEIAVPPLMFFGRRPRRAACAGIAGLQVLILATGNYTFFNLLTIALAVMLIDDPIWRRILPARIIRAVLGDAELPAAPARLGRLPIGAGLVLLALGALSLWTAVIPGARLPATLTAPLRIVDPFRSINSYGLFRVMTTEREEIVIEGSDDGEAWETYRFKYKPGDPNRRPGFVEPHQPRLDWQMWFAALSRFEATPWFQAFLARLLQGSPPVLGLLAGNPFPAHPPRYIRALLYDYRFSTAAERRRTGAWWSRRLVGAYSPVVSLK